MARIRTIKPEFFVSEQIADVSPTCRLLFVGMWLFCDDAGIHPASARQLKMEVFPGDDITTDQVRTLVDDLLRVGLLEEYEAVNGSQPQRYWKVTGWHHQRIERPRFQYPQPDSTTPRRHVDDTSTTPRSLTVPDPTIPETTIPKEARKRAVFVPPTCEEVEGYSKEIGWPLDGQAWRDSYASKGWCLKGGAKMKDWKAAVRNWKHNGWKTGPSDSGREKTDADYIKELQDRGLIGRDDD